MAANTTHSVWMCLKRDFLSDLFLTSGKFYLIFFVICVHVDTGHSDKVKHCLWSNRSNRAIERFGIEIDEMEKCYRLHVRSTLYR